MKNLLLSIFVFSCISCELSDGGKICCVPPPPSSKFIHIGSINASDEFKKGLSSKIVLYYLSEDGKKQRIYHRVGDVSFSNVSNLQAYGLDFNPCDIRVENHLSLKVDDLLEVSHQDSINRFFELGI